MAALCGPTTPSAPSRSSALWDELEQAGCLRAKGSPKGRVALQKDLTSAVDLRGALEEQMPVLRKVCERWPSTTEIYKFVKKRPGGGSELERNSAFSNVAFPASTMELVNCCNRSTTGRTNLYAVLTMPLSEALSGGAGTADGGGESGSTSATSGSSDVGGVEVVGGGGGVSGAAGGAAGGDEEEEERVETADEHHTTPLHTAQPTHHTTLPAVPVVDLTGSDAAAHQDDHLDALVARLYDEDIDALDSGAGGISLPLTAPVIVPAPVPTPISTTNLFNPAQFAESRYPGCRALDQQVSLDVYNTVDSTGGSCFLDQLLAYVNEFSEREVHTRPRLRLNTHGIGSDAIDAGGVFRHVTYAAVQEAWGSRVGEHNAQVRFESLGGRFLPSANLLVQEDEQFWRRYGRFLYWLLVNGTWAVGLHIAVTKFVLMEDVDGEDLRGCNDTYDEALNITDPEQDPENFVTPGPITTLLRDLGTDLGQFDLPPHGPHENERLTAKKRALANYVLISQRRSALMQLRAGFQSGMGHLGPPGLTSDFIVGAYRGIVTSAEEFFSCMATSTDWNVEVLTILRAAVLELRADEITSLQSWIAGHPIIPPQHRTTVQLYSVQGDQWRLPFAHTCFALVDLQALRYLPPEVPDHAAGVARMVTDLKACILDTQVLGAA